MLNNEAPASNVNALTADGLVVNAVKQDPNAIGYDGLAWQGKGQKALKVNGVPCAANEDQRRAAQVPALALHLPGPAGTAAPTPALAKFIDWARTSPLCR